MTSAEFGELNDPLERLARNERQGWQALRYVLVSAVAVMATAVLVVAIGGGPAEECADEGALCLTADRIELVVIPTLLSMILSVTVGIKAYRRWQHRIRWRPWLFASYAMWMITTAYLLVSSSAVFTQTS